MSRGLVFSGDLGTANLSGPIQRIALTGAGPGVAVGPPINFSQQDLATPDKLERVLRQFDLTIQQNHQAAMVAANQPTTLSQAELDQLIKAIRDQLQIGGSAPLNLTGLISQGSGTVVVATHAQRLGVFSPPVNAGALVYETDRNTMYISLPSHVYHTIAIQVQALANRPTDLTLNDAGYLFWASDTQTLYIWNGTAWNSTIAIGTAVGGGTAKSILFIDATGHLAQNTTFLFDPATVRLSINTTNSTSPLNVGGLPVVSPPTNANAITAGLLAGAFYRSGADPDIVYVVH
jgi:hypothetical protein